MKRNKFNARGRYWCVTCDTLREKTGRKRPSCLPGHEVVHFYSTKELKHYQRLRLRKKAGEISHLRIHPKYVFEVNGVEIGSYKPDFDYFDGNKTRVDDVKGHMNPPTKVAFNMKAKLMLALYGVYVEVV